MKLKESIRGSLFGPALVRLHLNMRGIFDRLPGNQLFALVPNKRLSKTKNIIFVWVPKNSGSTLYAELHRTMGMQKIHRPHRLKSFPKMGSITLGHVSMQELRERGILSEELFDSSVKFAIKRDPYSRFASLYNYSLRYRFIDESSIYDFVDLIRLNSIRPGLYNQKDLSYTSPQVSWLTDKDGHFIVDKVFRFEEPEEIQQFLKNQFGVELDLSLKVNASRNGVSRQEIVGDPFLRKAVSELYSDDFRILGYDIVP